MSPSTSDNISDAPAETPVHQELRLTGEAVLVQPIGTGILVDRGQMSWPVSY